MARKIAIYFVLSLLLLLVGTARIAKTGELHDSQHDVLVKEEQKSLLGTLGMDAALLQNVHDRQKIGTQGRECFYAMLAAVGRAKPGELLRLAKEEFKKEGKKSFSVAPLFNDPAEQRGRLVVLEGTARRVVRVRVQDKDILERFGIDHYYEIYLFTPDSQHNPLVFCVRDLPEGMPIGDDPQYSQRIEIAGFFMQTWRYRPVLAEEPDQAGKRQLAPLLIGREPRWLPSPQTKPKSALFGIVSGGLFIIILAAIWFALWRTARNDHRFRESRYS